MIRSLRQTSPTLLTSLPIGNIQGPRCSLSLGFCATESNSNRMEIFGLLVTAVALVLIGVGFAVGLIASALAIALVGLGVVSSSLVIGLLSKRPSAGIRALLIQSCVLAGIPAGAVCAWLGKSFLAAYGSELVVLFCGALGGAIAGVIVALAVDFIFRRLHTWASARFLPASPDKRPALERGA
jgi:MFS family permease